MQSHCIKSPVHLLCLRSMSNAVSPWWHHVVIQASTFSWCPDLCLHDRTPSLHSYTTHTLANMLLSTHTFFWGPWVYSFQLSQHTCTFLLPPLYFPQRSTKELKLSGQNMQGFLEPLVHFSYKPLTLPVFFPHIFAFYLFLPHWLNPGWSLLKV